jgi:hypothetical protein
MSKEENVGRCRGRWLYSDDLKAEVVQMVKSPASMAKCLGLSGAILCG